MIFSHKLLVKQVGNGLDRFVMLLECFLFLKLIGQEKNWFLFHFVQSQLLTLKRIFGWVHISNDYNNGFFLRMDIIFVTSNYVKRGCENLIRRTKKNYCLFHKSCVLLNRFQDISFELIWHMLACILAFQYFSTSNVSSSLWGSNVFYIKPKLYISNHFIFNQYFITGFSYQFLVKHQSHNYSSKMAYLCLKCKWKYVNMTKL